MIKKIQNTIIILFIIISIVLQIFVIQNFRDTKNSIYNLSCETMDNYYPKLFKIVSIENDIIELMDFNGFIFTIYDDFGDFEIDDFVVCIMYKNGTIEIMDDEIIDINYCRVDY